MKIAEKESARKLRKNGKSINTIVQETGFSKASVSLWVRDILLTQAQKKKISMKGRSVESIERRRLNRLRNEQNKRELIINEAKKDFQGISLSELKIIGIILYWGEGGKTNKGSARLTNCDPVLIKVIMRFFREVCLVPESKFRGHIHTFNNANAGKAEKYWSGVTNIPRKQFYKTYIKKSSATLDKRKTLPYGTVEVSVNDTKLYLTIMGWIERIKELT